MSTVLSLRAHSVAALKQFRCRLRSMSDHPELLYDLMGFGLYREMALTRDGMLIAASRRSPGFDTFLGPICPTVRNRTGRIWIELCPADRDLVLCRLFALGITPNCVGIPIECSFSVTPLHGGIHGR